MLYFLPCHVVTCLCFVAFDGMFFSSFLFASFFVYCVCVYYNWLLISIINVYICASNLRWPELFSQGPRAVRQGRSNCKVGVARVAPRVFEQNSQRICVWNETVVR
jgi:hypothetical protein